MKAVFAFAVGSLLLAAVSVHALTQTPDDAQPTGLISEDQIPAAAATCKAALDLAVKTVTAANGDFTGVTQPTGATLANSEFLYCFTVTPPGSSPLPMKLTVFPGDLQGKTYGQELFDTTWPQASMLMIGALIPVQLMNSTQYGAADHYTTDHYATSLYSWDITQQATQHPPQWKFDLLEGFTVGANKYGCGCGYKLVSHAYVPYVP